MKISVEIDLLRADKFVGIIRADPITANYFIDLMTESGEVEETFMLFTGEWNDLCRKQREKNKMYNELFKDILPPNKKACAFVKIG